MFVIAVFSTLVV